MTHILEQAATLIEQHMATLDTTQHECPCCKTARYNGWSEFLEHKELTAVVTKLRRFSKQSPK